MVLSFVTILQWGKELVVKVAVIFLLIEKPHVTLLVR